jgi:ubiquitin carboxyl-terminal hydrolase 34
VLFPPQERVINLVKSTDESVETMLPMSKPYNLLYSVNALTDCLRAEALEVRAADILPRDSDV